MNTTHASSVGIQPRIVVGGHDYMLVSDHYAALNAARASEAWRNRGAAIYIGHRYIASAASELHAQEIVATHNAT